MIPLAAAVWKMDVRGHEKNQSLERRPWQGRVRDDGGWTREVEIAKRGQIQDSRYGFEVKRTSPAGWPMSGYVWVQLGDRECRDPTESHQGCRGARLSDAPNFPLRQVLQKGAASSKL